MADKLAFVEVPGQLAYVPSDYHVISLSPVAEVALEQMGRPYTRPADYLDEMVLEEEGIANFAKVETLCAVLDAIFADAVQEVAEHQLQPARWHYFWLKIIYDAFFIRTYQLRWVLAAEAPQEVLYFRRSQPDLSREWISQAESLYAILLDHLLPPLEIAGKRLGPVTEHLPDQRTAPRPESRFSLLRVLRSAGRRVRRVQRALEMLRRVRRRAVKGRVLCLDYGYSIPHIIPELQELGYNVWVWRDELTIRQVGSFTRHTLEAAVQLPYHQITAIWRAVEGHRTVRDLFCWEGYDVWPAVAWRLRRLVERGLLEVLKHYAAAQRVLTELQPDVVLMSMASFAREKAICHAARQAEIPTVVSRHGELGTRDVPIVAYQDVDSLDWALCWGRWEAEWTRHHGRKEVRTMVVGSPMIEAAARTAPRRHIVRRQLGYHINQRIALYVPTGLSENWWYASHRCPGDSSYFRQGQQILQALMNLDDCRVVIKEHPAVVDSPLEEWCRSIDTDGRVSVIRQPGFAHLTHLSDVVVLDAPSTTLVQALTGGVRIYIVNHPVFRWESGVVEHLTAAGVVFCTAADLEERIRADITAGLIDAHQKYIEDAIDPLAAFCSEPGGAAHRAAQAILQIAAEVDRRPVTGRSRSYGTHI